MRSFGLNICETVASSLVMSMFQGSQKCAERRTLTHNSCLAFEAEPDSHKETGSVISPG